MVLKDHLIHLLTLNMDKYITTNKNTEASPDQPISHSHRHLLWAGQALPYGGKNNNKKKKTCMPLQPNPSELVCSWWFVSLCRNTSGQNVSERQRELQLSV